MSKIGIIKNIAIFALGNPYKNIEKSIEKVSVEDTEKLNEIYKEICVFDMTNPKGKKCIKPESTELLARKMAKNGHCELNDVVSLRNATENILQKRYGYSSKELYGM